MKTRTAGRPQQSPKYRLLCHFKKHGPLSVADLKKQVSLSYMGIKQHCMELERDGYLSRRRRHRAGTRGRPEEVYSLTPASREWFPCHDTPLTQAIMVVLKKLYGSNAPEKVIFTIYQDIIHRYRHSIHSMLLEERIQDFLRVREGEGYLMDFSDQSYEGCRWTIRESHSPVSLLLGEFPVLLKFELQVYQKVLHPGICQLQAAVEPYRVIYGIPEKD